MTATDFSTPDLADAAPGARALALPWRDYGGAERFCGQAVTVKCFEDNSKVKALVGQPGRGRVMVVDGGESPRRALLGDQLGETAVHNGWAGLVIAGAVRDVEILRELPLGVKALAASPLKTEKRGEGQQDISIEIAGVEIRPDDWVYADVNGVLISREALRP